MSAATIILIEDDEVFASVISRALQRREYEVFHAADIASATLLIARSGLCTLAGPE